MEWSNPRRGKGGSGLVVLRYQIASLGASLKATGGNVSFYNGKTIHAFTSSGVFANTSGSPLSIEYVCLAVVVEAVLMPKGCWWWCWWI